jgi:GT2 family glycosyltransferase
MGCGAGSKPAPITQPRCHRSSLARLRLSVVIVSYNSAQQLRRTLPPLLGELAAEDELIVADNGSEDGSAAVAAELAPQATVLALDTNRGFAAACNTAAATAGGELLVILNPDAEPLPGFGEAIRTPYAEGRGWDAWMALVTCEGATRVNSRGNPVHFTGLAWAGGHGEALRADLEPREVPAASGACLAIPLAQWRELGGFPEPFFLYHEDIDLSFRIRLAGGTVGLEPAAMVDHDYEFEGGRQKWRWLERNRLAFLVRVYPAPLLALLAPALLVTELALVPASLAGGWFRAKLLANLDALRWLPRLLRERREIQAARSITSAELGAWLTPDLDSPNLPRVVRGGAVRAMLRAYWRLVRLALRISGGNPEPH